jgi:hypothetical protein
VDQSLGREKYENRTQGNEPFLPGVSITRPDTTGVLLVSELRTSGLLLLLPAVDLKCLITLLTFAVRNGQTTHCIASLRQLAYAMHTTEPKARRRLTRLQHVVWDGKPLVHEEVRANGLRYYIPSSTILANASPNPLTTSGQDEIHVTERTGNTGTAIVRRSPVRDVIVAENRRRYTQPRDVVEQHIAEQMGWRTKGTKTNEQTEQQPIEPEDALKQELRKKGLSGVQADYLLKNFDRLEIQQQLEWLPLRNAKSPGRYLYAAIENRYAAPRGVRIPQNPAEPGRSNTARMHSNRAG